MDKITQQNAALVEEAAAAAKSMEEQTDELSNIVAAFRSARPPLQPSPAEPACRGRQPRARLRRRGPPSRPAAAPATAADGAAKTTGRSSDPAAEQLTDGSCKLRPRRYGRSSRSAMPTFAAIAQTWSRQRPGSCLGDSKRDLVYGRLGRRLRHSAARASRRIWRCWTAQTREAEQSADDQRDHHQPDRLLPRAAPFRDSGEERCCPELRQSAPTSGSCGSGRLDARRARSPTRSR